MANVIIHNEERQSAVEYVAQKYGIDTRDPAMREAAEITAREKPGGCRKSTEQKEVFLMNVTHLPEDGTKFYPLRGHGEDHQL